MVVDNRVVNSHNDWSPLEEVIVGTPYHVDYSEDVSSKLFFYNNLPPEPYLQGERGKWTIFGEPPSNQVRDEALADLETFIAVLAAEHVVVRRPQVLREVPTITTPWWSAPMGHAMMSRDLFVVIDDEIIETPPMVRARYYEGDLYKELFTEYFRNGARWTMAPRSRLREDNFDYSYAVARGYTDSAPKEVFLEMMFDGPQILRLGSDLIFNWSTENHRMGAEWLRRHLGPDYRIHEVNIADHHIDALLVALRPGTLLIEAGVPLEALPEGLRRWDVLRYEPRESLEYRSQEGTPFLASTAIGMNVLSLDEEKVVVQDTETELIAMLDKAGFTPIPCRWRHPRALGGGFHCMTLDIRRRGTREAYL
jgi:glycine amidinotransferase